MRPLKTTLIVATLNEINGMKAIMPQIRRNWVDEIIVLDGGSKDGTIEWARENGYLVHVQEKPGLRNAYMELWPKISGEVVITFSPDGNSIPELIPVLVEKMRQGFDMVIASRYKDGAKSHDDDFITALGNRLFTSGINLLHGGAYTDAMVIYRAYRKNLVYELGLDREKPYAAFERIFGTRVSWEPLLSVRAARAKMKIAEIPGDEPERIGGERKLQVIRWGAVFALQVLANLAWKPDMR